MNKCKQMRAVCYIIEVYYKVYILQKYFEF